MLPSTIGSSTPVDVTVCASFQFGVVNGTLAGATVPSVRSELVSPTVTLAVGWLVKTTVNVAVPPEIGRASCRERVKISAVAASLKKKTDTYDASRLL